MATAGHTAGMEFRFTGTVDLEILAATDLKPITITGGRTLGIFDPFVVVDFDEIFFCQTIAKAKTLSPTWREHFTEDVQEAESVTFTLFHKAVVPPDPFIGHIRIQLDELFTAGKEQFEVRRKPRSPLCSWFAPTNRHTTCVSTSQLRSCVCVPACMHTC